MPKYDSFYNCVPLLKILIDKGLPTTEAQVRVHLLLSLRFLMLFRGIDLARASRLVNTREKVWKLTARRKGRLVPERYLVHAFVDYPGLCPQALLSKYLDLTSSYEGSELFLSLPVKGVRRPLSSDRINSLTKEFLKQHGISDEFDAHSTRGSAVSALISFDVKPEVIFQLGDWKSFDCFLRFYHKVLAQRNPVFPLVEASASHGFRPINHIGDSASALAESSSSPPRAQPARGRREGEARALALDTMPTSYGGTPS